MMDCPWSKFGDCTQTDADEHFTPGTLVSVSNYVAY